MIGIPMGRNCAPLLADLFLDTLSFEIWIFRNGQPDRENDHSSFVAITSTLEQPCLNAVRRFAPLSFLNRKLWKVLYIPLLDGLHYTTISSF
jgi:hypothetical protein